MTTMKNSTHKVEVFRIKDIEDHPNADRLELTSVWGYTCIVRRDQFKVGDLAAYIPPDSVLPETEEFAFVWKNKPNPKERDRRIRASRLRGLLSAGLVIEAPEGTKVGDDIADKLGVTHYEPKPNNNGKFGNTKIYEYVPSPRIAMANTAYDIENGFRYHDVIPEGTPVTITEKIHGCLIPSSLVRMADDTNKKIGQIEVGDEVLGVDESGQVVSSIVTEKFDNGTTSRWLQIKGPRRDAGRGNSYFSIRCTPEHRFFIPARNRYVEAKDLSVDDVIVSHRTEYDLTPIQKSVLIGKMLGDGSLQYRNKNSAFVIWGHTSKDRDYVDWCRSAIGDIGKNYTPVTSGHGSEMFRSGTTCCPEIRNEFDCWIVGGKKTIPQDIVLNPISLAFWYMDDGSLQHNPNQEDSNNSRKLFFG